MSTSEYREGTPGGQARKRTSIGQADGAVMTRTVRIEPGEYYFTEQVTEAFQISDKTLDKWAEKGLRRPDKEKLGMRRQIYFGDWLLEFVREQAQA